MSSALTDFTVTWNRTGLEKQGYHFDLLNIDSKLAHRGRCLHQGSWHSGSARRIAIPEVAASNFAGPLSRSAETILLEFCPFCTICADFASYQDQPYLTLSILSKWAPMPR
jgi:hypothetical protein